MGLRSYPINVQKIVREKMNNAPKAKSIPNILISNILLFTIVFSIMGLLFKIYITLIIIYQHLYISFY